MFFKIHPEFPFLSPNGHTLYTHRGILRTTFLAGPRVRSFSSLCLNARPEDPGSVRHPPCAFLAMRSVNRSNCDPLGQNLPATIRVATLAMSQKLSGHFMGYALMGALK